MTDDINDGIITVKSSKVREEILRELHGRELVRPSEMIDPIKERTETSKANFYQNLQALEGEIVTKTEGQGRATLYTLTDYGTEVAERLGLDEPAEEASDEDRTTVTSDGPAQAQPPQNQIDESAPDGVESAADDVDETAFKQGETPVPQSKDDARQILRQWIDGDGLDAEDIEDLLEELRAYQKWNQ